MSQRAISVTQVQGLIRDIQVGFSSFHALVLTAEQVSIAQFAVLVCLAQRRPRKMSDVAKALHISFPAVTHLVDRLEAKRLVRRRAHPTDRRVSLVDMTDRGVTLVAQTQGRTLRILTHAFLKRSVAQRTVVLKFLQALRAGIQKAAQDAERRP